MNFKQMFGDAMLTKALKLFDCTDTDRACVTRIVGAISPDNLAKLDAQRAYKDKISALADQCEATALNEAIEWEKKSVLEQMFYQTFVHGFEDSADLAVHLSAEEIDAVIYAHLRAGISCGRVVICLFPLAALGASATMKEDLLERALRYNNDALPEHASKMLGRPLSSEEIDTLILGSAVNVHYGSDLAIAKYGASKFIARMMAHDLLEADEDDFADFIEEFEK